MRILFLSRWFPYPTTNGSKIRILNLLRGLAPYHKVTLLSFSDRPEVDQNAPEVNSICENVHTVAWREYDPYRWRAVAGFLSPMPRFIVDTFSPLMAEKIEEVLCEQTFDLVIASQLSMAAYVPYLKHVPVLFEEMEIGVVYEHSIQNSGRMRRLLRRFTWFKFHFYVSRLLQNFRAASVVSEKERELITRNFPRFQNISVVPNGIDMKSYESITLDTKPNTMIFTGPFRYHANYEAMVWFVGKVLPLILEKIPDAELIITGDHLNLPLPAQKNIRLTGYVDDIQQWLATSAVALAPLWSGGGTRVKILEAMAIGTPVVATPKGAEGLDALHGEHLFIADSPEEFASHIIRLMSDRALAHRISSSARQFVKANFDWEAVIPGFLQLVEQTAAE